MDKSIKVNVIGLGYIGLPTAAVVADKGIEVLGVDINPTVVDNINAGKIHIAEPELDVLVKRVVEQGFLKAALTPEYADVFLIVVPTPFRQNHRPDLSYVKSATQAIIPCLRENNLVLFESTSPVGTTEKMAELIWKERPDLKNKIGISYCPERVLPGNVIYELEHNDRVIGGINNKSTQQSLAFYRLFVNGNLHATDTRTAEMCKLTENASRDVQIAFANELSIICDKAGINVWELVELANKHPRVTILQPSCGVGGHCIAVDPWFIVSDFTEQAQMIKRSRETNDYKADWCTNKILETCIQYENKFNKEPAVACMGLSFKPDIDDLRESPAKYIVSRVIAESRADVLVVEPHVRSHKSFNLVHYEEAYNNADIVVWLVRHQLFLTIQKQDHKIELDFCGVRK